MQQSDHLIERLEQWPSCPAGADPMSSAYVGDLMKEAASEIERLRDDLQRVAAALNDIDYKGRHSRSYGHHAMAYEIAANKLRAALSPAAEEA